MVTTTTSKPLLRGHLHQAAFFIALGACGPLIAKSLSSSNLLAANSIYSLSLLLLFAISSIYHRVHWQPKPRAIMKRLDHSAIFVLIAGTFTPICVRALPETAGNHLLLIVWGAAIVGLLQSVFWVSAPKWLTAIFYVGIGWSVLPYLHDMQLSIGPQNILILAAGGVAYTIGAIFYALKKPNIVPGVFGYHELFHLLTIVGAGLHFAVIYSL